MSLDIRKAIDEFESQNIIGKTTGKGLLCDVQAKIQSGRLALQRLLLRQQGAYGKNSPTRSHFFEEVKYTFLAEIREGSVGPKMRQIYD